MACSYSGKALFIRSVSAVQVVYCPVPCTCSLHGTPCADACKTKCENSKPKQVPSATAPAGPRRCSICHEVVRESKFFGKRRFGILENCSDVFCLPCIRNFHSIRNRKTPRRRCSEVKPEPVACPRCGAPSNYILSSLSWVEDPEQKSRLFREFQENTWSIPCEFMRRGFECISPEFLHDG
ncbi:probable E3 ubiquitin-protein ligase makorin-1 [Uloborus diversus]|uniref:probable E3 ubiquitin-protein ligase makorin-1 n=1 Tax=Uloborus diversus TaxID=327109 RepID=UPI0024094E5B|nr:probable E3 ubiquitin-protein ligase makorin-1 [Uloborus diversus]